MRDGLERYVLKEIETEDTDQWKKIRKETFLVFELGKKLSDYENHRGDIAEEEEIL